MCGDIAVLRRKKYRKSDRFGQYAIRGTFIGCLCHSLLSFPNFSLLETIGYSV